MARPGVVDLADETHAVLSPLGHNAVSLRPGSWLGTWQAVNRAETIPHCLKQLAETGTLDNLRKTGEFAGPRRGLWFSDSDVYKTLEGVGWELASGTELRSAFTAITGLIARAQDDDGYVHSWFGLDGREPWSDLTNGHEMYCAGHLIQAGVAGARGGDGSLLEVARRFADLLVERFGSSTGPAGRSLDGGRAAIDGHPEIEMALVELWRQTGCRSYLDLAAQMVQRRGHGTLGSGSFGSSYYLDLVLRGLHLSNGQTAWLIHTNLALIAICVLVIWFASGLTMVLLMAGMQGIPGDLLEAAAIDGASWLNQELHVRMPLLRRTIAMTLIISVVGSFLAFNRFYILTQGGPGTSTDTVVMWIYQVAFVQLHLGRATALSLVLVVLVGFISFIQFFALRDRTA